jgi:hypothetical protein
VLLAALAFVLSAAFAHAGDLRAGFATADLTPPLGLEMGGFGPFLGRKNEAIHDKLLARAVVLELNGRRMAIVGCDLGSTTLEMTSKVRKEVELATGIPASRIMVSVTHTHSAPTVTRWIGWGEKDPKYLSELPSKIAAAIIGASKNLAPVSLLYGEAPVEGVARNREYEGGPIDPNVRVLKFVRDSKVVGFIAHHSVHPVVMAEQTRMTTGDLTGIATNQVMAAHPGSVGIFLQGSCGDINPIYVHLPPDVSLQRLDQLSNLLTEDIEQALGKAKPVSVDRIDMSARAIQLPLVPTDRAVILQRSQSAKRWLEFEGLPDRVRRDLRFQEVTAMAVFERFNQTPLDSTATEIQVGLIADILIVGNPGETFLTFGDQTAALLPGHRVLTTGYTNDYVGYIPAADRYDVSGQQFRYAAYFVPWIRGEFQFREDVGDVLVQEMVKLARDVLETNHR